MNEPKPFASLSSGLLARKGQAKPAMRPQGFGTFGAQSTGFDDLGWNDMGHDRGAPQVGLTPMDADPVEAEIVPLHAELAPETAEPFEPVVFQQREEIERSYEAAPIDETPVEDVEPAAPILMTKRKATPLFAPAPVAEAEPAPAIAPVAVSVAIQPSAPIFRAPAGSKARAAFTLRLDQDRHLKLRLAAAVAHRSAQALVIEALDAFLANTPAVAGITPGSAN
ncbi:Stability/partitioning determinant [Sphingomonas antarctica]|uniref:hypothetical protein n=1 Tax=Sphingomonas antarctica TaxID=2040274 RepID=UPI0039E8E030